MDIMRPLTSIRILTYSGKIRLEVSIASIGFKNEDLEGKGRDSTGSSVVAVQLSSLSFFL
jgi:hypothetical protein